MGHQSNNHNYPALTKKQIRTGHPQMYFPRALQQLRMLFSTPAVLIKLL
jgi:hypothetical protein